MTDFITSLDIDIFKESADEKARNNCMGIVKKKGKKVNEKRRN